MDFLSDYSRQNRKNKNLNQPYIDSVVNGISEGFKYSPSYFQVTKNNDASTLYDCWIQEVKDQEPKDGLEKKNIIFYPGQTFEKGDYIYSAVLDKTLLIMSKPPSPFYDNGEAWVTNNHLKFKNSKGEIANYSCTVSILGRMYLDISTDKMVILPKDTFLVSVQSNEDTKEIIESTRFILNNKAFKVMALDNLVISNVIQMKLQSDLVRSDDDLVNGIASQTVQTNTTPANLAISGSTSPRTGSTNNVYNIINNTIYTYTFSLIDALTNIALSTTIAEITSQTDTSCIIKINTTSGGKQFFIKAIAKEDVNITAQLLVTTSSGF